MHPGGRSNRGAVAVVAAGTAWSGFDYGDDDACTIRLGRDDTLEPFVCDNCCEMTSVYTGERRHD